MSRATKARVDNYLPKHSDTRRLFRMSTIYSSIALFAIVGLSLVSLMNVQVTPSNAPPELKMSGGEPFSLFDSFSLDNMSLGQVQVAVDKKVVVCMRKAGWRYIPPEHVLIDTEFSSLNNLWTYARNSGYGLAMTAQTELRSTHGQVTDPNEQYLSHLSRSEINRYNISLNGPVSGSGLQDGSAIPLSLPMLSARGCEATSERLVMKPLPFFNSKLGPVIRSETSNELKQVAVRSGERAWVSCMVHFGFPVTYYDQAEAELLQSSSHETPTQVLSQRAKEFSTAKADRWCYIQDLHGSERQFESATIERIIKNYPAFFHKAFRIALDRGLL